MSNAVSFVRDRKTENLSEEKKQSQQLSNQISDEERSFKGLHTPDFSENKKNGAIIVDGEADSALYLGQDARYGTTFTTSGSGGDFANKIVLAVGFLNEGKKDGDQVDLSSPDLRYGAGLTIYQRTDTGKDAVVDTDNAKNRDRKATTKTPQRAVSVFEINADVVEVKSRNGGVNIVAGYDPTLPSYGSTSSSERANTDFVGVSLIFGNPDEALLNDEKSIYGLQPLVKGANLTKRLNDIAERISDVNKVVMKIQKAQLALESVLAFHTHPTVGIGAGIALPSIELGIASLAVKIPANIFNFLSSLTATYNQAALKINSSELSEGSILSRFNYTN